MVPVQSKFSFPNLAVKYNLAGLTVLLLSLITSSFVSLWLYKSVIAIFDSIIIIMINDYEYHSTVSIRLCLHIHQDKNKVWGCVKTVQEPAVETHSSADLHHFLGFAACQKPESPFMYSGFYVVVS